MKAGKDSFIVIGGGLAGLVSSIMLNRTGLKVSLLEKKAYPFHRVCGEYISVEVRDFLQREGLFPEAHSPPTLSRFHLSAINGKLAETPLPLGGFGISRYVFDQHLAQIAKAEGVDLRENTEVTDLAFDPDQDQFTLSLKGGEQLHSYWLAGAYGKRSLLDKRLERPFMKTRSPWMGVKYHVRHDYPEDLISLHNFPGGYCGASQVEDGKLNLCYLARRSNMDGLKSIEEMEAKYVVQNSHLREIWEQGDFLFEKPEVINEISFAPKGPLEGHMFMVGDSAGLITPLCGNGMAMAIGAAAELGKAFSQGRVAGNWTRQAIENTYRNNWRRIFSRRLWVGRKSQYLFGNSSRAAFSVGLLRTMPALGRAIIRQTHGRPF